MKFEAEVKEGKVMNQGWRGKESVNARLQAVMVKASEECNGKFIKSQFMDFLITAGLDTIESVGAIPGAETEKLLTERDQSREKKKPAAKRFVAPCSAEVFTHIIDIDGVDKITAKEESEKFVNYWSDMDWKRNGQKMKSWKGSATNWIKNGYGKSRNAGKPADRLATPDRSALKASVAGEQAPIYRPLAIEGEFNECE